LLTCSEPDEEGKRKVFMRLNGQTRIIEVQDRSRNIVSRENAKIDKANARQVGAPLQGKLSQILIKPGDDVKRNQPLFVIEAMKMETTVASNETGKVKDIILAAGSMVKTDDLVLILE
jgi:pyruvate carboxylase